MKKIFSFLFVLSFCVSFAQNTYRYTVVPGSDNTYAIPHKAITYTAYSATLTVTPQNEETVFDFASLTGNLTLNVNKVNSFCGDKMYFILRATTSTRTVTWGTNITGLASTLSVATTATKVVIMVFDGTNWVQVQ